MREMRNFIFIGSFIVFLYVIIKFFFFVCVICIKYIKIEMRLCILILGCKDINKRLFKNIKMCFFIMI